MPRNAPSLAVVQEHRQGPLEDIDAGDAERAPLGAPEALRGARVLGAPRQGGGRGHSGRQVSQCLALYYFNQGFNKG